jgi:hypothetical protein
MKPGKLATSPVANETAGNALVVADQAAQTIAPEAVELLKMVGRIEMAGFFLTVGERAIVETYIKIKETKAWLGLEYVDDCGNVLRVRTLDEFCRHYLKKSYVRCQALVGNYHLLGPELYEQAEQIGLRQRDYDAIKALPADDQAIIKNAIATEDKAQIITLLQEMAIQHGQEKQAAQAEKKQLATEKEETEKQLQASRARVEVSLKQIAELDEKLEIKKLTVPDPDEQGRDMRMKLMNFMYDNQRAAVRVAIRSHVQYLLEHGDAHGVDHRHYIAGLFVEVEREYQMLRDAFDIPAAPSPDVAPEWLRDYTAEIEGVRS